MSPVLILLRKSLLNFSRARAAITITFAVPVVLIFLFGHVFGLFGKDSGPKGIPLAVVNDSKVPAAQQLVDALKAEKTFRVITQATNRDGTERPLTEADVRAGLRDNDYRFALLLPVDLVSPDRIGLRMKFLSNPRNEMETQMVNGILQKTVFSNVPQLLGQSLQQRARQYLGDDRFHRFNDTIATTVSSTFGGDPGEIRQRLEAGDFFSNGGLTSTVSTKAPDATPANIAGLRRLDTVSAPSEKTAAAGPTQPAGANAPLPATKTFAAEQRDDGDLFSRIAKIETEQVAGKDVKNPMAARIVGGYAIMFLLMAVSGSAASLFEERDSGVFQRLLASPVRPAHILWARFLFGLILGLGQIATMLVAGRLFFGLEIFHQPLALFAVILSAAAACSAFGMLVAAIAPNASAASGIATFTVISMSAVGGAWFPVSIMPPYIQQISKLTVVYWGVEGITDVLWAGNSLLQVLPKVGILAGIATGVMAFSIWRFNRSKFFE
jgi:ABC-2 type transport system permease protein